MSEYISYFFGYGSLMNIDELAKCLLTTKENILQRVSFVKVKGLRRGWLNQCSVSKTNNGLQLTPTYLCCYSEPKGCINGIIIPVTQREQDLIHQREKAACYKISYLSHKQIFCYHCKQNHSKDDFKNDLPIYFYSCDLIQSSKPNRYHPIVQSYVDLCLNGTIYIDTLNNDDKYGFSQEFIRTTDFWIGQYWINDRIYKYRPSIFLTNAELINSLLVNNLPESVISTIQY